MTIIPARMQQRRRTYAQWASENPVLAQGEFGVATVGGADQVAAKVGDGVTAWNTLGWYDARPSFSIAATELDANGMTRVNSSRVPRIQLPATGTSTIYVGAKGFPTYWFNLGMRFGFDCVNDHSSGGNVRMQFILQQNDIGGTIAGASTPLNVTETLTAPGAGGIVTQLINGGAVTTITGGTFGSLFTFAITRLGDDAADTLGGPFSICEFVYLAAS